MDKRIKESKSAATIRRRANRNSMFGNFFSHKQKTAVLDPFESDGEQDEAAGPISASTCSTFGPKIIQSLMSSQKKLFLSLVALRLLSALIIQTSYVPDEYWQSTEVAHNMVFGYGYLTWEWKTGIRSYLYPLIYAVLYKFLAIFHMDSRFLMVKGPRLLQGLFAAVGDFYVYHLSIRLSGTQVAKWTLFCQLTSWFIFYTSTRTLTNSMEAVLTSAALYYYPWPGKSKKAHWKFIVLVGVAVIMRPTASITWLPLFLWYLYTWRHMFWKVVKYSGERGLALLAISSVIDRLFYGQWVNVHYNFLQFNVLSSLSAHYGTHSWHWYLTQGLPVVLGTHLIILLVAVKKYKEPAVFGTVLWSIAVYSFLGHKEFRFLCGILPLVMHICGCTMNEIFATHSDAQDDTYKDKHHNHKAKVITVSVLLVVNIPMALYFSLIHQRGTIDVMSYIHKETQKTWPNDGPPFFLYLMPCHSTPYYSYVHKNVSMYFLTCEPNLTENELDEADMFYSDPLAWLSHQYAADGADDSVIPSETSLPTHIIMFEELYLRIATWLHKNNFFLCARFFHTHFPEGRVSSYVVVACHSAAVPSAKGQSAFGTVMSNASYQL